MDSVPSYRPASVPPPVIPTTPSLNENSISGRTLIGLGFILGFSGLYMMFNGTSFNFASRSVDTPSVEKMAAMDLVKQQVVAEGRPVVSISDKLGYLNALQNEIDAEEAGIEEVVEEPAPIPEEYYEFMKQIKAENDASAAKGVAEAEASEEVQQ